jgi:hypothetical protein
MYAINPRLGWSICLPLLINRIEYNFLDLHPLRQYAGKNGIPNLLIRSLVQERPTTHYLITQVHFAAFGEIKIFKINPSIENFLLYQVYLSPMLSLEKEYISIEDSYGDSWLTYFSIYVDLSLSIKSLSY